MSDRNSHFDFFSCEHWLALHVFVAGFTSGAGNGLGIFSQDTVLTIASQNVVFCFKTAIMSNLTTFFFRIELIYFDNHSYIKHGFYAHHTAAIV